jgi:hypothetical protein
MNDLFGNSRGARESRVTSPYRGKPAHDAVPEPYSREFNSKSCVGNAACVKRFYTGLLIQILAKIRNTRCVSMRKKGECQGVHVKVRCSERTSNTKPKARGNGVKMNDAIRSIALPEGER